MLRDSSGQFEEVFCRSPVAFRTSFYVDSAIAGHCPMSVLLKNILLNKSLQIIQWRSAFRTTCASVTARGNEPRRVGL